MKRIVMLEVEVRDDEHLRQVARSAAYGAWSVLGDTGGWNGHSAEEARPLVMVAVTERATEALRTCWDLLPPGAQS